MNTIMIVRLWDKEVAAINWNENNGYANIEFFQSFAANDWDIAPIVMSRQDLLRGNRMFSFPTHRGKTFKGLPGLLADSLPDDYGNSVIDEWFAAKQMAVTVNPLDRLSYIGKRGMGALEFEPATDILGLNESSRVEIDNLVELAKQILNKRKNFSAKIKNKDKSIMDILRVGTSAGGAKPKAIIAFNESTKELRSGQVEAPEGFSYWILKFDGVEGEKLRDNPPGIGRIEYAYYKMATDCGINMTESRLLQDGKLAHFMTKRFDRTNEGEKLHIQTLCAIAHFDRDERYSYEQLFQTMRKLYLPYSDVEQMYRRMIFNVIARNQDDHTKNHSFIMNKSGEWSLAPAYDICYAYSPSGQWTNQHQLSLNNKRDNFTAKDLLMMADKADVKNARKIIRNVIDVVSNWEQYAQNAGVKTVYIKQIKQNLRVFNTKHF